MKKTFKKKEKTTPHNYFAIPGIKKVEKHIIPIDTIISICCDAYNVDLGNLLKNNRIGKNPFGRQLIYYFVRQNYNETMSVAEIGDVLGLSQDHATVIHACKTVIDRSNFDKNVSKVFCEISDRIKDYYENYNY